MALEFPRCCKINLITEHFPINRLLCRELNCDSTSASHIIRRNVLCGIKHKIFSPGNGTTYRLLIPKTNSNWPPFDLGPNPPEELPNFMIDDPLSGTLLTNH